MRCQPQPLEEWGAFPVSSAGMFKVWVSAQPQSAVYSLASHLTSLSLSPHLLNGDNNTYIRRYYENSMR